jgi:hypothetical protein
MDSDPDPGEPKTCGSGGSGYGFGSGFGSGSATLARRLIFLEFLKASIADLITLFLSSLHNSEGGGDSDGGDSDGGDSFANPCQFLPFLKTFSLSPSLLRPLAKNLQKQKLLLGSM